MFATLPNNALDFMSWEWERIAPYYEELAARPLTADTLHQWLVDWSAISKLLSERFARLRTATTQDTNDEAADQAYNAFLEEIFPPTQTAEQQLKAKLLQSGLTIEGMEIPIRKMQADADLFSEANLPLMAEEQKKAAQYNRILGGQTVVWEGEEKTLTQLNPLRESLDRDVRERVWRLIAERQLADRDAINALWQEFMALRKELAANAGYDDYRAYRWKVLKRFDYTPEDSLQFHRAIEEVVVPAANRIYEAVAAELGVSRLRPWDVVADVFPINTYTLKPFSDMAELEETAAAIFNKVHPKVGQYFATMRAEGLLDLPNRKGKGPGAYCTYFPVQKRPFIFMNAVGTASDVKTLLHEAGHAFHSFEAGDLPYPYQRHPGAEFAEVASMSMELLASPYLTADQGGFYQSAEDAAWHKLGHLQKIVTFWPYMAVVDAFQHWVYANHAAATNPANCDEKWAELWQRFVPAVDFSGFEDVRDTGWHRKLHIHKYPFYYVEYGMAQVNAIQVWANALQDQETAVEQYLSALALGGTRSLPELYAAAGGRFQFDASAMQEIIDLLEQQMAAYRQQAAG
jgi:oligoendopeptidase F